MNKKNNKIALILCILLLASLGPICKKVYYSAKESAYEKRMLQYQENHLDSELDKK